SALSQFDVQDTLNFFEANGIIGVEKTLGQLFPESNKARDIVKVFTQLCDDLDQKIICGANVLKVEQKSDNNSFTASGPDNRQPAAGNSSDKSFSISYERNGKVQVVTVPKVVFASGGLAVQKMGATDLALRIARDFGI